MDHCKFYGILWDVYHLPTGGFRSRQSQSETIGFMVFPMNMVTRPGKHTKNDGQSPF